MTHEESIKLVQKPEYDFLKTNPHLDKNIILLGLSGSHAYGTNLATSDVDIRGIALNSKSEILLNQDFSTIVDTNTDTTIYSFNKIIFELTKCNPNLIEMLGLDQNDYIFINKWGQLLLDNKHLFLSKLCTKKFCGYATEQLYRLQQKSLYAMTNAELNTHITKVMNSMCNRLNTQYHTNIMANLYDDEIVLNGTFENVNIKNAAGIISELNNTYRDYTKHSHRNQNAIEHGKIAKHSEHLVRVLIEGIDILENHVIQTKRVKEHDLLMDIRTGSDKYFDNNGQPNSSFYDMVHDYNQKFEYASKHTTLPDEPNYKAIDELRMYVNQSIITSS